MVKRWRGGVWGWAVGVFCIGLVADEIFIDVTGAPSWRFVAQACVAPIVLMVGWQSFTWRASADAEGLRVRTRGGTRRLPWADVADALPGPGTSLSIRLTGDRPPGVVLVPWSGLRPPKRAAAEITAMAADPGLRPS